MGPRAQHALDVDRLGAQLGEALADVFDSHEGANDSNSVDAAASASTAMGSCRWTSAPPSPTP